MKEPTLKLSSTRINLSLTDLRKTKTLIIAYQKKFKEVVENKYKGWKHIYTHGSKSEVGVEAAGTTGNCTESAALPKVSSIIGAETHSIHLALETISASKGKNFSVSTDSRSCLQELHAKISISSKVRKLKHTIANLYKLGKTGEHACVPGNEIANKTRCRGHSKYVRSFLDRS